MDKKTSGTLGAIFQPIMKCDVGIGKDDEVADDGDEELTLDDVIIYDISGDTCGASLLTIEDGFCGVKSTTGDTLIGGENFDNRVVDFFMQDFKRKNRGKD